MFKLTYRLQMEGEILIFLFSVATRWDLGRKRFRQRSWFVGGENSVVSYRRLGAFLRDLCPPEGQNLGLIGDYKLNEQINSVVYLQLRLLSKVESFLSFAYGFYMLLSRPDLTTVLHFMLVLARPLFEVYSWSRGRQFFFWQAIAGMGKSPPILASFHQI